MSPSRNPCKAIPNPGGCLGRTGTSGAAYFHGNEWGWECFEVNRKAWAFVENLRSLTLNFSQWNKAAAALDLLELWFLQGHHRNFSQILTHGLSRNEVAKTAMGADCCCFHLLPNTIAKFYNFWGKVWKTKSTRPWSVFIMKFKSTTLRISYRFWKM